MSKPMHFGDALDRYEKSHQNTDGSEFICTVFDCFEPKRKDKKGRVRSNLCTKHGLHLVTHGDPAHKNPNKWTTKTHKAYFNAGVYWAKTYKNILFKHTETLKNIHENTPIPESWKNVKPLSPEKQARIIISSIVGRVGEQGALELFMGVWSLCHYLRKREGWNWTARRELYFVYKNLTRSRMGSDYGFHGYRTIKPIAAIFIDIMRGIEHQSDKEFYVLSKQFEQDGKTDKRTGIKAKAETLLEYQQRYVRHKAKGQSGAVPIAGLTKSDKREIRAMSTRESLMRKRVRDELKANLNNLAASLGSS
ncbi:hypothetical protein [Photobacterium profundum]|uniref:hypothetical protein n=1 Tax=Photobacterium profundum TaxID=74109 RepID=UPI00103BB819|nr:hypothetical protein [Photobacterium profundum]